MKNFTNYKNDTYFITSKLKNKVNKITRETFNEEEINAYILIALDALYIKKHPKIDISKYLENKVLGIAFSVLIVNSVEKLDEKQIKSLIKKREHYYDKANQGLLK